MEETAKTAQEELTSLSADEVTPQSLDEVAASLQGFGIEEFEEILTLKSNGKVMRLRLSNICTEDEMMSLMAVEGLKGQVWTQNVKCEILSRAISWLQFGDKPGISLRSLPADKRITKDPKDGQQKDIQVVLRNLIQGWGQELQSVLWKCFLAHAQRIEDRLVAEFPAAATTTDIEARFTALAMKEIEDSTKEQIRDTVAELFQEGAEETPAPAPAAEVKTS